MNTFDITVVVANFDDAERVSRQLTKVCDSSMVIVAHHRTITRNIVFETKIKDLGHHLVIRNTTDIKTENKDYYGVCSNQMCFKSKLVVFSPKVIDKIQRSEQYLFTVNGKDLCFNESYCLVYEKEFYHLKDKIIGFNAHSKYDRIEDLMNLIAGQDII